MPNQPQDRALWTFFLHSTPRKSNPNLFRQIFTTRLSASVPFTDDEAVFMLGTWPFMMYSKPSDQFLHTWTSFGLSGNVK